MKYNNQFVERAYLKTLNTDFRYHWEGEETKHLRDSMETFGLLQPLIIYKGKENILLDGHRRLDIIMKYKELYTIPILEYDRDLETLFQAVIEKNNDEKELNIIEKTRVLRIVSKHFSTADYARWQQILSLPTHTKHLKLYKQIQTLGKEWQTFFIEKKVPVRRIMNFIKAKDLSLYSSFIDLGISLSKLENIIELCYEISRKTDRSEKEILSKCFHPHHLENRHSIIEDTFQALYALRNPVLARYKKQSLSQISELKLEPQLRLSTDLSMESRGLTGRISIENETDLDELIRKLSEHQSRLKELLKRDF